MKYYGAIGYRETIETKPGVYEEKITERSYYGDVITFNSLNRTTDQVNDNITLSNQISIVADPYANQNFSSICYIEFMGTRWKVSKIAVAYPRLILTMGEVYNGK